MPTNNWPFVTAEIFPSWWNTTCFASSATAWTTKPEPFFRLTNFITVGTKSRATKRKLCRASKPPRPLFTECWTNSVWWILYIILCCFPIRPKTNWKSWRVIRNITLPTNCIRIFYLTANQTATEKVERILVPQVAEKVIRCCIYRVCWCVPQISPARRLSSFPTEQIWTTNYRKVLPMPKILLAMKTSSISTLVPI